MNIDKITAEIALPVGAFLICAFILFTIWKWATTKPVDEQITSEALLALLTRIQVLDSDIVRLNEKVNVVLRAQENNKDLDK